MPFLAFWAACVSAAPGRDRDLPWAVLAGRFFAHGHAAQPLLVAGPARATIEERFSPVTIGARYRRRLEAILPL